MAKQSEKSACAAIYVNSLAAGRGAERVICTLLTTLAARGRRVDLLVEDTEGALLAALRSEAPGVRIHYLKEAGAPEAFSRLAALAALAGELFAGALAGKPFDDFKALSLIAKKDKPSLYPLRRYLGRERPRAILSFLNDPTLRCSWRRGSASKIAALCPTC